MILKLFLKLNGYYPKKNWIFDSIEIFLEKYYFC